MCYQIIPCTTSVHKSERAIIFLLLLSINLIAVFYTFAAFIVLDNLFSSSFTIALSYYRMDSGGIGLTTSESASDRAAARVNAYTQQRENRLASLGSKSDEDFKKV